MMAPREQRQAPSCPKHGVAMEWVTNNSNPRWRCPRCLAERRAQSAVSLAKQPERDAQRYREAQEARRVEFADIRERLAELGIDPIRLRDFLASLKDDD